MEELPECGVIPVEYKVVIYPDPVEKMCGVIEKPPSAIEKEHMMQAEGVLVAKSDMAFEDWKCDLPNIGDRVMFSKFSGQFITEGENEFRVMNDKDIVAILRR